MISTKPFSLRDIPLSLFRKFIDPLSFTKYGEFRITGGKECVSIRRSIANDPDESSVLVFKSYSSASLEFQRKSLFVFDYPVTLDQLDPNGKGILAPWKMEIAASADNPPHEADHENRPWVSGKGYWVKEWLVVTYGSVNRNASVISEANDQEFEFLLQLQREAHALARNVAIRGHWQRDWNPNLDYSTKHESVR